VRFARQQALQLRAGLPRRGVRRDQQAQGLEDVQNARRGSPLACDRPDTGCQGRKAGRNSANLLNAAEALVDGIASGAIRTKAGERYKPSVVREYERSLRLHILPALGGARLSKLQRRDVQRLVDEMLESRADPSTIRNALKPLQVIYRRAIEDGDLALNPCERLRLPAARGRRERIA